MKIGCGYKRIFFNFRFFENLNFIFDLTFENLQKWTPVALSLGDRGLSPDHRATGPLSPSGRVTGCFLQNLHGHKHRNVAWRPFEGPVARPLRDRALAPGPWAAGHVPARKNGC